MVSAEGVSLRRVLSALMLMLVMVGSVGFMPTAYGRVQSQQAFSAVQSQSPSSFTSSDPLQIFLYVRNNFIFELYYGYMKGVNGTLNAGGGNDFDQAAVLVYLLRHANVQARYVEGKITLSMDELENWLGMETSNATLSFLGRVLKYQVQADGSQTTVQFFHVWVEAYLNGAWVQMDPSYKQYVYHESMTAYPPDLSPLPMSNGTSVGLYGVTNIDTSQMLSAVHSIREKSVQALGDLNYAYPLAYRTIISAQDYTAPPAPTGGDVYDEFPAFQQYQVEVTIPSFDSTTREFTFAHNVSARFPTASLSESRVSLYFVPVDDKTLKYIQSFPDLMWDEKLDPGKVQMRPVLRFSKTQGIMGEAMPLGYFMPLIVRVLIEDREASRGQFRPQVGAWNSLVINTGDIHGGDTILVNRADQLYETLLASTQRKTDIDDMLGALLDIQGRLYFNLFDVQSLLMLDNFHMRAVHTVDAIMTGIKYDWVETETGSYLSYAGPTMDSEVGGWHGGGTSANDDHTSELLFNLMWECLSSYLEGQAINLLYHTGSVSTVTLLEAANEQGVPIFLIDQDNWDKISPQLSLSKNLMSELKDAVDSGSYVIVPQHPITTTALAITLSENPEPQTQVGTYVGTPWMKINQTGFVGWRINNAREGGDSGLHVVCSTPCKAPWQKLTLEAIGHCSFMLAGILGGILMADLFPPGAVASWFIAAYEAGEMIHSLHSLYELGSHVGAQTAQDLKQKIHGDPEILKLTQATYGNNYHAQTAPVPEEGQFFWSAWATAKPVKKEKAPPAPSINGGLSVLGGNMGGAQEAASSDYGRALISLLHPIFLEKYVLDNVLDPLERSSFAGSSGGAGAPSFAMYLTDDDGREVGVDLLTKETHTDINYPYLLGYGGNATSPQTLGLWGLKAGDYSITVSGSAEQNLELLLAANAYPSSSSQSVKVEVPRGAAAVVPLNISYPHGILRVKLGNPVPATFIRFQKAEGGSVRGQLLDAHLQGIDGKEVSFFYRPPSSFTGWTPIGSAKTSTNGDFSLDWSAAPPGETTVMVTYGDYRAFSHVEVRFPVTINIHDLKGVSLSDRDVTVTANNETTRASLRNGSVTFNAYPGYNVIEINPLTQTVVYTPVPCQPVTIQLNVQETATTSTTSLSSSTTTTTTTPAMTAGLPNAMILAAVAAVALLLAGAVIVKKKQNAKQTKKLPTAQ